MTLSLGAIFGPGEPPGFTTFRKVHLAISKDELPPLGAGAVLNVVFIFPDPQRPKRSSFSGIRTSTFSRKDKILMVQVAVPEEAAFRENSAAFFLEAIRAAIRLAKPVFEKAGIPYDADADLAVVDQVAQEWRATTSSGDRVPPIPAEALSVAKEPKRQRARDRWHWLSIHLKLSDGAAGTKAERDELFTLQEHLERIALRKNVGELDGNEIGEGWFVIYLTGRNASKMYDALAGALHRFEARPGSYAMKRGGPPKFAEERIDLR
jgi:hypothetical protein